LPVLDLGGSCDYVLNTKLLGSGNWELAWGDVHCSLVDKPVLQAEIIVLGATLL